MWLKNGTYFPIEGKEFFFTVTIRSRQVNAIDFELLSYGLSLLLSF